jgi:hypothetical protein
MGIRAALIRLRGHAPAALIALPALFLFACAAPSGGGSAAAPGANPPSGDGGATPGPLYALFHRAVKSPSGAVEVLRLHGRGVQIFRCEEQSGTWRWTYRLPEAELRDAGDHLVARHGANLSFEHVDGSRLLGEVVDHVPSPDDNALPWLLLAVHSYGQGALSGMTYVQRIDTAGGMPPAGCAPAQVNQVLRVPFSADFVFWR